MRVAEYPLSMLHWVIRRDPWVRAIFLAAGVKLDELAERILDVSTFEDSEAMMSRSLALWERILGITPEEDASMEARRADVRAMWLACLPPSIATIQAVCDAWRAGEIEAEYEAGIGTIVLYYLRSFGPQEGQAGLVRALDIVKPAHLALEHAWRYLKIKEVHRQMSIAAFSRTPQGHFAGYRARPLGGGAYEITGKDRPRDSGVAAIGDCLLLRPNAKVTVREDGDTLYIESAATYEAPAYEQIGDGVWAVDGALTIAADNRVTVREDGDALIITDGEEA